MGLEHYLNADFDLSLRSGWRKPDGETARRRITDLMWHALFLAEPGDSVLVPEPAPSDFVEYLDRSGIEVPRLTLDPNDRREQRLSPFGWNAGAAALNQRYDDPTPHPPLEIVTRVNGRRFSARLEDELFGGGHTVAELHSEVELLEHLTNLPRSMPGLFLKAEHGNAGLGNRRLRKKQLPAGDLKVVRRFFDEGDAIVLERWRPRLRDLCATFSVTQEGRARGFRLHEIVNTADGALIGVIFEEDPEPLAEWRSPMADAAMVVASRLAETGYFGPVCMDAFVWNDGGRPRLRLLVDLNARREMSAGASVLWRRLGGRGAAYWRFFTRRKIGLPDTYPDLEGALANDAYDAATRAGVLVTAPLWLGVNRRTPAKTAILILGRDRGEVLAIDQRIRERFER